MNSKNLYNRIITSLALIFLLTLSFNYTYILINFFLVILNHSYEVAKKKILKKKVKKVEPFITKNKEIGMIINELSILFSNSFFIKFFQNFF